MNWSFSKTMKRRSFLSGSASFAGAPFLMTSKSHGADYGEFGDFKKRVALIGSGWYGKIDLLRLIQVAPVEVVGLCDVDSKMLSGRIQFPGYPNWSVDGARGPQVGSKCRQYGLE